MTGVQTCALPISVSAWIAPTRPKGKAFTVAELNALRPGPREYKLYGKDGLIVLVTPKGAKHWRWKFKLKGRASTLALGSYPAVSLAEATARLADAKRKRANGVDPVAENRRAKAGLANTFELVAREWLRVKCPELNPKTHKQRTDDLTRHIFPRLGPMPLAQLSTPTVLPTFQAIADQGKVHTARRLLQHCNAIADFAIVHGHLTANPFGPVKRVLPREVTEHQPAITDPKLFGELLRAIDSYGGDFLVVCALQLSALLLVRPSELRHMRWAAIDVALKQWELQAVEKKEKRDFIVPLCLQALAILKRLKSITGEGPLVLGTRGGHKPMSENTLNAAMHRMGFAKEVHCAHGFRASGRTMLEANLGFSPVMCELQIAHKMIGPMGDTYARHTYLAERHTMMQRWADYLDQLRAIRA